MNGFYSNILDQGTTRKNDTNFLEGGAEVLISIIEKLNIQVWYTVDHFCI